jgi:hypothetical protein
MREALKNAIAPGRTRAGSNVETLVDAVEIKRSAIAYLNKRLTVPFDRSDVLIIKRETALIKTLSGGRNHE